jgi:hypothetical protein
MRRTIGGSKPPRRWIWRRKGSTGSRARSQRRQRGSSGREQGGRRGLVTADGHHARVEQMAIMRGWSCGRRRAVF